MRAQEVLATGGSALDAAIAAVVVLEDDGRFNAGAGSVLRMDGVSIEMDAAVRHRIDAVWDELEKLLPDEPLIVQNRAVGGVLRTKKVATPASNISAMDAQAATRGPRWVTRDSAARSWATARSPRRS